MLFHGNFLRRSPEGPLIPFLRQKAPHPIRAAEGPESHAAMQLLCDRLKRRMCEALSKQHAAILQPLCIAFLVHFLSCACMHAVYSCSGCDLIVRLAGLCSRPILQQGLARCIYSMAEEELHPVVEDEEEVEDKPCEAIYCHMPLGREHQRCLDA